MNAILFEQNLSLDEMMVEYFGSLACKKKSLFDLLSDLASPSGFINQMETFALKKHKHL